MFRGVLFGKFNKVVFCFWIMKMKDILKSELGLVRVDKDEILRLKDIASDFIESLKREGLRAFVGGSLAKGTMIRKAGKQDIDIFVVFDYSEDILGLGDILKKVKLPGELSVVHGSRDYFHVDLDDVVLEVIPVVENKDPELAENVTDMSLSHVRYVSGEIDKDVGLAGEIMLAKAFCRAQKCYGAEGYVRGFSGYSLEVLVIYFGSFVKFLKGIKRIRVVDSMKYFKGRSEIMREINASKLQGPLVVIDPTYKFRNVCAGLGLSTFERFLEVSGEFLKKPSLDFFNRKEIDVEELVVFAERKKARFLELEFSTDRQEGDIAGTKMRKMMRFFERELIRKGQVVLKSEFDYDGEGQGARGYLVVLESGEVERKGPSVGLEREAERFCEANKGCYEKGKFWWCKDKVSVERVLDFVKGFEGEMGVQISLL